MHIDVVLNLFGTDMADLAAMARAADAADVGALWVNDHFSGHVVGARWSRDPFVALGALAAITEHVELGLLVANLTNRHPAQLASAVNSVQSLAPHRVRMGLGSGAAAASRFASEHDMIGKRLGDAEERTTLLRDSIGALRDIWANVPDNGGAGVGFTGLAGVVDTSPIPPIVVGASAWSTIQVAVDLADGVNIRRTAALGAHLARLADLDLPERFEVSVLDTLGPDDPIGVVPDDLRDSVVDRYIVTLQPGRDLGLLDHLDRR